MKDESKNSRVIEALHLVIAEFEDNPVQPEDANDVIIEVMSNKIERLTEEK